MVSRAGLEQANGCARKSVFTESQSEEKGTMKLVLTYDLMNFVNPNEIRELVNAKNFGRLSILAENVGILSAVLIEDNDLNAAHKEQPASD